MVKIAGSVELVPSDVPTENNSIFLHDDDNIIKIKDNDGNLYNIKNEWELIESKNITTLTGHTSNEIIFTSFPVYDEYKLSFHKVVGDNNVSGSSVYLSINAISSTDVYRGYTITQATISEYRDDNGFMLCTVFNNLSLNGEVIIPGSSLAVTNGQITLPCNLAPGGYGSSISYLLSGNVIVGNDVAITTLTIKTLNGTRKVKGIFRLYGRNF